MPANVQNTSSSDKFLNISLILTFIILVTVTIIIRIRTLAVPLERDEGEYAYSAQLMLQGVPPYSLAYNMKMPGIYAVYAIILAIFGQTVSGIHFSVVFVNTATVILLFFMTRKLFGSIAGVAAAVFFAIASISDSVKATANAENFVILPAIIGILLLMKFVEAKKKLNLVIAGLMLGIAFMIKQHAFGFIIFGYFFLFWKLLREKTLNYKNCAFIFFLFSFSVFLPFIITCLILWYCGVFDKFWFWTFDYARNYVSVVPFKSGMNELKMNLLPIIFTMPLIWLLSLIGLLSCLLNKNIRQHGMFIVGFIICSFLAVCPGLYFRQHYFMLFLPVVVILAGAGIVAIQSLCGNIVKKPNITVFVSVLLLIFAWLHSFYIQKDYLFENDTAMLSRISFGISCFPEMVEVAKYIKDHSTENDKIAVLGSEPEIYFYSQRRSATSYIYMYPLMEPQSYALDMQREMISQIETSKPRFLVFINNYFSWLTRSDSVNLISQWLPQYAESHYQIIGTVEYFSPDRILYHWKKNAAPPKGKVNIIVFERID